MHTGPRHHLHVRSRIYKNLAPYPHPDFLVRVLDRTVYVAGILGPVFAFPQIYAIYAHHTAAGVSALSWSAFAVFNIVWILYGYVHKEQVLVVTYTLSFIVNSIVALGAVLYG